MLSELVKAWSGALVAAPDPALYAGNCATDYVGAYNACLRDREACLKVFSRVVDAALEAGAASAGVGVGAAETVVSWLPGLAEGAKHLVIDGKVYASVAAECAAKPAECVEKGKHYYRNRRKRQLLKERVKGSTGPGESAGSGVVDDGFAARRAAENKVAQAVAERKLKMMQDPKYAELQQDIERSLMVGKASAASVRSQKALSELESIRPESSASMAEYRQLVKDKEEEAYRAVLYEELARKYAPREDIVRVKGMLRAEGCDIYDPGEVPAKVGPAATAGLVEKLVGRDDEVCGIW